MVSVSAEFFLGSCCFFECSLKCYQLYRFVMLTSRLYAFGILISDSVSKELVATCYWRRPRIIVCSLPRARHCSGHCQTAARPHEGSSFCDVWLYVHLSRLQSVVCWFFLAISAMRAGMAECWCKDGASLTMWVPVDHERMAPGWFSLLVVPLSVHLTLLCGQQEQRLLCKILLDLD